MKRSERMLSMAKAKSKVDEEIGREKYETTKGLEATEIDLLLQGKQFSSC
jgi:L-lactate utilization protein LutB